MSSPSRWREESPCRALVLVRNTVTHDARVLREARTLLDLGFEVTVLGVTSTTEPSPTAVIDGVPVERLTPKSPLNALRGLRQLKRPRRVPTTAAAPRHQPPVTPASARRPASLLRVHRWLTTLAYYHRGIAAVRRLKPHLVHCNDYNTMWIGVAARLLCRSAVVYDAHELWPDRNQRPEPRLWLLGCEAAFVRLAHRTITTSPGYADVMAARYRVGRPRVVRNIPSHPSTSEIRSSSSARSTVVYSGALTTNRGVEQTIEALALAPQVRLRLVGPGGDAYIAALRNLAETMGVADRVEFAGAVGPDAVVGELVGAAVGLALIQPACLSYELTLPNKLFEYLAAGLPILGSDLPVIRDFIEEHHVGMVVDPRNPHGIASALSKLLAPEENEQRHDAARAAGRRLTWASERVRLEDTYLSVLSERARDPPEAPPA